MSGAAQSVDALDVLDIINRVAIFNGGLIADDLCAAGERLERVLLAAFAVKRWHAIATGAETGDNYFDARDRLFDEFLPALREALAAVLPPQLRTVDAS